MHAILDGEDLRVSQIPVLLCAKGKWADVLSIVTNHFCTDKSNKK